MCQKVTYASKAEAQQDALTQKIEVQRLVIEKLERQIHEEPRR